MSMPYRAKFSHLPSARVRAPSRALLRDRRRRGMLCGMGQALRKKDDHYTYGDYLSWPDGERWELINGTAWNMSPAPSRAHQEVLGRLYLLFATWLRDKPCRVFLAPFDVILPAEPDQADREVDTVVQPDLSVFCDPRRLTDAGARGAPDLVVEILSPWTSKKDLNDKFTLYETRGVREYWVVDPAGNPAGSVQIYHINKDGLYDDPEILVKNGLAASEVLEGFTLEIAELFPV
ncbi:MAG: Uma2 family endonuclease [Spirochaetaceae bacterium]|nr:MAG: Uma2 family endonuclease [Spirochaetaceae bacterium]